jgi:hypothetical protein
MNLRYLTRQVSDYKALRSDYDQSLAWLTRVRDETKGLTFVDFRLTASTGSTEHLQERPPFEQV